MTKEEKQVYIDEVRKREGELFVASSKLAQLLQFPIKDKVGEMAKVEMVVADKVPTAEEAEDCKMYIVDNVSWFKNAHGEVINYTETVGRLQEIEKELKEITGRLDEMLKSIGLEDNDDDEGVEDGPEEE